VQTQGLSPRLIPVLCRRYQTSSIAVALQMLDTAPQACYLVIAAPVRGGRAPRRQRRGDLPHPAPSPLLTMVYTAASPAARYAIKRGQVVPRDHPLATAWRHPGRVVRAQVPLPCASGRGWEVACEAVAFRRKVFAFFHAAPVARPGSRGEAVLPAQGAAPHAPVGGSLAADAPPTAASSGRLASQRKPLGGGLRRETDTKTLA